MEGCGHQVATLSPACHGVTAARGCIACQIPELSNMCVPQDFKTVVVGKRRGGGGGGAPTGPAVATRKECESPA
eukprot:COSAG01_NODE_3274_length_6319_cov_22.538585_3_plen_74_part_00